MASAAADNMHRQSAGNVVKPSGARVFRIAMLLESQQQPHWVTAVMQSLIDLECVEITLIFSGTSPGSEKRLPAKAMSRLCWRIFQGLDSCFMGREPDAFAARDVLQFSAKHAARVKIADGPLAELLDAAILFGEGRPRADNLLTPRHGIWQFRFGNGQHGAGSPPGFWEVVDRVPITGAALYRIGEREADDQVLYQSYSRTSPFSVRKNRDNLMRKAAQFPARVIARLQNGRAMAGIDSMTNFQETLPLRGFPSALDAMLAGLKMAGRIAYRAWQKLRFVDQWFLAYRFVPSTEMPSAFHDFIPIFPPKDRFWADPFPICRDGRFFVFFEELMFATQKGHIAVAELCRDGSWRSPKKVLERNYHLSYPFLFEWESALYMIPETGQNRTVEVYRCTGFPDHWVLEKVLLQGLWAVDATLAEIDGRWWMFVTVGIEGTEIYDELHLYYAQTPLGVWQPHALNPVVSDVRRARPAGRVFQQDGHWVRPAQNCAPLYGTAMTLNRITRLTPDAFAEEVWKVLPPDWQEGLCGFHTLNRAGDLVVVDGFMRRAN